MKKMMTYFVTFIMLLTFTNQSYAFAESIRYETTIPVTIEMDDQTNNKGDNTVFKAVLTAEDGTEKELDVKSNTTAYFKGLTYTKVGDYTYTLKQKVKDDSLLEYDLSEYTVLVRVLNDGQNGLTGKLIAMKSGESAKSDIVFHNHMKPIIPNVQTPPTTNGLSGFLPFTGEQQMSIVLALGILAFDFFLIVLKKKSRDSKEE
ncbi:hypothetical protein J7S27_01970 [Carnobacteriaceae bacterium zg-C25]|nr:hypothetical protein J7S27_01970 [Carnobacteriaceae bacterium zg-C25]